MGRKRASGKAISENLARHDAQGKQFLKILSKL